MGELFSELLSGPFGILFGSVFALVIVLIAANWVKMTRNGVNPLTVQADLVTKLAKSELLGEQKSIESRLSELDRLLAENVISADEYKAARLKILSS